MRTIGVREFRDQASSLLASDETLIVERHGEAIGFYVPITAKDRKAGADALGRLGSLLGDLTDRTGLDEDGLVREITPRRRSR